MNFHRATSCTLFLLFSIIFMDSVPIIISETSTYLKNSVPGKASTIIHETQRVNIVEIIFVLLKDIVNAIINIITDNLLGKIDVNSMNSITTMINETLTVLMNSVPITVLETFRQSLPDPSEATNQVLQETVDGLIETIKNIPIGDITSSSSADFLNESDHLM